jgi:subtilase family serine protease
MRRLVVAKGTPGALAFRDNLNRSNPAATSGKAATIGPDGGLTPLDFSTAYGLTQTTASANQTVAIVDAYNDPNIGADLNTFDTQYGLPACALGTCLKVVGEAGTSALPSDDTTGWSVEETLDVETVHSVCQKCKIILVEANGSSDSDLGTAEDSAARLGATEISNSFGGPETGSSSFVPDYNHPGIVITVSAGDAGYYNYDSLGAETVAGNLANSPASYNTVVSVGGTSLYLGQTGARQSETVWNDNGVKSINEEYSGRTLGASGGGCSGTFTAQPWQTHVGDWAKTGCGTKRLSSDVAADADYLTGFDIYDSYTCASSCVPDAAWYTYGGTSLAAPLVGAMFGLAGGAHGVAYPALTLYGHLGTSALYDVAVGGNGYCDGEGAAACGDNNSSSSPFTVDCDYNVGGTAISPGDAACDAGPGYDGPTGVGTPNNLTAFAKTGPTGPIVNLKVSGKIAPKVTYSWEIKAKDPFPGGKITKYLWNWGDGSKALSVTAATEKHAYAKAGTYHLTVTATDNYGQTGISELTVTVS